MGREFFLLGEGFKFGFIGLTEPSGNGECDPHPPPAAGAGRHLPPREGKGMWKPLFLLIPKEKYRLFKEKAPISSCLPSPQGKVSPASAAATDEGHTKGFLLLQTVRQTPICFLHTIPQKGRPQGKISLSPQVGTNGILFGFIGTPPPRIIQIVGRNLLGIQQRKLDPHSVQFLKPSLPLACG